MISESQADHLYRIEKVIHEDVVWEFNDPYYEIDVSAQVRSENITLSLRGWYNGRQYSYSLIHQGAYPIRRFGIHSGHVNPDGREIHGPHKHKWKESVGTEFAYEVDDVSTNDIDQAFYDFLDESNIQLEGNYYTFEGGKLDDYM